MPTKKLDTIKQIIHLSDIHIRLLKRHEEYNQLFQKLYIEINKVKDDNTIIIITGDIVHSKTEMSPEMIDVAGQLLLKLSNICPTYIIAGNHDVNLNNKNRLDALTPIVNLLQAQTNNLHYLIDTGVYTVADTDLVVLSVFNDIFTKINKNDIKSKNKIALFHGTVNGSKTDTGMILKNDKIDLKLFDGYDMVLLGDIHKHQKLQSYHIDNNIVKPEIVYAGSFAQQNHGEDFNNHGFVLWDVDNRKSKLININNDFGYYTIKVKDNKMSNYNDIPTNPRLRVIIEDDTPYSVAKELITELRKQRNVQSVIINKLKKVIDNTPSLTENVDTTKIENVIGNIKNALYQNQLIEEYILSNHKDFDKNVIEEIKKINIRLNADIKNTDVLRNIIWKLKTFEFSNMFSYGEKNIIDFTHFEDVNGLFAQNASGKSSLISALLFCLFDKCERTSKAFDVMNYNKDNFQCKLKFELNGLDYYIERRATKNKKGKVSVDVDFYYYDSDNKLISLNGTERKDTNAIIRTYIGTFENLTITSFSTQGNDGGFINTKQAECKDLLAYYLEIDIFDKLLELANKEIKDIVKALKEFQNTDYSIELNNAEQELANANNSKRQCETEQHNIKVAQDDLTEKILEETKKLIKIENVNTPLNVLESNRNKTESLIKSTKTSILDIGNKIKELNNAVITTNDSLCNYDIDEINNKIPILNDKIETKTKLEKELAILTNELKNKKSKLEKLKDLEYDEDCKYCMNNIFVKDAIETKTTFDIEKTNGLKLANKLDLLTEDITNLETYSIQAKEYNDLNNKLTQIKSDVKLQESILQKYETDLKLYETQLQEINKKINQYNANIENIKQNILIEQEISNLKQKLNDLKTDYDRVGITINNHIKVITTYENKIKTIKENIQKIKLLEIQNKAYTYYLQAINRQGIPYQLISRVISIFENEINNILHQMVDFEVRMEMDGEDINRYIDYGNDKKWALELTSGMERFISSIAIRSALINISNLPRPNGFIIDEGFGVLDTDNISNVYQIFDYLKQSFDFILIVSHLDIIKDIADNLIDIYQDNDRYSHIEYL